MFRQAKAKQTMRKTLATWSKDSREGTDCPKALAFAYGVKSLTAIPNTPDDLRVRALRDACGPVGAFVWYTAIIKTTVVGTLIERQREDFVDTYGRRLNPGPQRSMTETSRSHEIVEITLDNVEYAAIIPIHGDNILNHSLHGQPKETVQRGPLSNELRHEYRCSVSATDSGVWN